MLEKIPVICKTKRRFLSHLFVHVACYFLSDIRLPFYFIDLILQISQEPAGMGAIHLCVVELEGNG